MASWLQVRDRLRPLWWTPALIAVLLVKGALILSGTIPPFWIFSGIYLLLLVCSSWFSLTNALHSTGSARAFSIFLACGFGLWAYSQFLGVYYPLAIGSEVPVNSTADPALFLHVVPFMAAAAIQVHLQRDANSLLRNCINFLVLLLVWLFVYAYFVLPYQSWFPDVRIYDQRFTALYAFENAALVLIWIVLAFRARGRWKHVYLQLLGASTLYCISSTLANLILDANRPYAGGAISLSQMAAVCWFAWIVVSERASLSETTTAKPSTDGAGFTSLSTRVAVAFVPLVGLWELFQHDEPRDLQIYRLAVILISLLLLSAAVFLKEDLIKREIMINWRASRSRENVSLLALAESEDRYRDLFEHSEDLVCTHNLEGNLLTCNPVSARLLGYSVEEILAIPMRELLDPAYVGEFDSYLDRIKTNGRDQGVLAVMTRSGERRLWQYNNSLRTEGIPTPVVRGMAHDVTEQRRAEHQLRVAEERFRQLAENIHEIFYLEDAETLQLLYVSPAYEQIWGRSCPSAYADPASFLEGIHPEDREAVRLSFRARAPLRHEYRVLRPDGTIRWIWDRGFPIRDREGRVYRMAGIAEDITERKQTERAIQEAQANVARMARFASMGELTASIAHEINQPLTAVAASVSASLRWVAMHPPEIEEAQQAMTAALKEVNRASDVVKRIRSLLTNGSGEMYPVDVNDVIQDVVALLEAELRRAQIVLATDLAPVMPRVRGDRVQLQQVLINLVMNSIDALENVSGRPREIIVCSSADARGVQVQVLDSGSGLSPEFVDRIFQPFFTTKAQGIGMGLSISRSILESHGGALSAVERQPHGAAFQFTLPRERAL
jgi:PAS domain S-box-containing protein